MGGECCSLVILCLGAVATLSAIALVSVGVITDHWTHTAVDRTRVHEHGELNNTGYMYFTRNTGLFRICFVAEEKPAEGTPDLYLSIFEDWCYARKYYINDVLSGDFRPEQFSDPGNKQLQLLRATPLLLFVYLLGMGVVGLIGLCGCWQQSANKLITTAALQLVAALVGASAMATWHAALFFEMEKVHDEGFPLSWPPWLQESTSVVTSWSYILTWIGVCLTLLASLATSSAAICLRSRRRWEDADWDWEDNTMRMKLKMNSMFAHHTYFPQDIRSIHSSTDRSSREYPTIPANFPTSYRTSLRSPGPADNITPSEDRVLEYKKVVTQMEDSRF